MLENSEVVWLIVIGVVLLMLFRPDIALRIFGALLVLGSPFVGLVGFAGGDATAFPVFLVLGVILLGFGEMVSNSRQMKKMAMESQLVLERIASARLNEKLTDKR